MIITTSFSLPEDCHHFQDHYVGAAQLYLSDHCYHWPFLAGLKSSWLASQKVFNWDNVVPLCNVVPHYNVMPHCNVVPSHTASVQKSECSFQTTISLHGDASCKIVKPSKALRMYINKLLKYVTKKQYIQESV